MGYAGFEGVPVLRYKHPYYVFFSSRAAHAHHLNTLLEQLLKDAGLSVDWKETILPLVKRVSEQVHAQQVKNYLHLVLICT